MAISEAIRSASAAEGGGRLMRPLSAYAAELNIKAAETTKAFHMAFWHTEAEGHLYNKKAASGGFSNRGRTLRNSLGPWPSPSIQ
jgi:hypothetical protein